MLNINWTHFRYSAILGLAVVVFVIYGVANAPWHVPEYTDETLFDLQKGTFFHSKTCPCNIQRIFSKAKIENFHRKKFDIILIFAQNIDCGYTLEPPRLPRSIF